MNINRILRTNDKILFQLCFYYYLFYNLNEEIFKFNSHVWRNQNLIKYVVFCFSLQLDLNKNTIYIDKNSNFIDFFFYRNSNFKDINKVHRILAKLIYIYLIIWVFYGEFIIWVIIMIWKVNGYPMNIDLKNIFKIIYGKRKM